MNKGTTWGIEVGVMIKSTAERGKDAYINHQFSGRKHDL